MNRTEQGAWRSACTKEIVATITITTVNIILLAHLKEKASIT